MTNYIVTLPLWLLFDLFWQPKWQIIDCVWDNSFCQWQPSLQGNSCQKVVIKLFLTNLSLTNFWQVPICPEDCHLRHNFLSMKLSVLYVESMWPVSSLFWAFGKQMYQSYWIVTPHAWGWRRKQCLSEAKVSILLDSHPSLMRVEETAMPFWRKPVNITES